MYCSPESLADPSRDQSAYALDPLQVPELMDGRVLLTWPVSKLGNAVGKVKKDCIDGDDLEVPQVKLSLTATVAALRAQYFSSLQKICNSDPESANPPPLSQTTVPQPAGASARLSKSGQGVGSDVSPAPPTCETRTC
ncbi:hypothetical protein BN14_11726 [Rhizoctonia solani AG-1 IB]|uniref:Uncharacterized protein n=1 Tax=Thanatephorus cucumeris (strain AG1-IB / isolate 7/3/14) TaxID=1108050 RepID=M5CEF5_THACB|nr:hypothetical protein BN14_11726 [Rhizoctonia solani AG-1 IB]